MWGSAFSGESVSGFCGLEWGYEAPPQVWLDEVDVIKVLTDLEKGNVPDIPLSDAAVLIRERYWDRAQAIISYYGVEQ